MLSSGNWSQLNILTLLLRYRNSLLTFGGWKLLFDALWRGFSQRFDHILTCLARHSDMIDREAHSISICRAEELRRKAAEDYEKQETLLANTQLQGVLAWLNVQDWQQEDELDQHVRCIHANSCSWIQQHSKVQPWLSCSRCSYILWINGNPGAGEAFLAGKPSKALN